MNYKRTIDASHCSMFFDIEGDITQPLDQKKVDLGYALLNHPFPGRFYMTFDGNDVMARLERQRNLYPLEFVKWLSEHFQTYLSEGKPREADTETWNQQHILAYHLGDYSPQVGIYRTGDEVIEIPDAKIRISPKVFATQVLKVSADALKMLRLNPSFENHPRTDELEARLKANTDFLKNI